MSRTSIRRLYRQALAAGRITHPQWYDTQPAWRTIATRAHEVLKNQRVGAHTQSYGFYGNEMIFPVDFFK